MLGVPAEVYTYGTQHATVLLSEALVAVVTAYVFMPVFYKLQLFSSFEASHLTSLRNFLSYIYYWEKYENNNRMMPFKYL